MIIAHYIGSHARDAWGVRIGWAATRFAQKGPYGIVTHTEAVLAQHADGSVTIGSATLRPEAADGGNGVRCKSVRLVPGNWLMVDVPAFDVMRAVEWFEAHRGQRYDTRGALACLLPGKGQADRWYCTESVAASVGWQTPDAWCPAEWAAITLSIGRDVTRDFFGARNA